MKKGSFLILLLLSVTPGFSQDPAIKGLNAINQDVLKAQLEFLSSDWMEGRRSGERGEQIASDYIASMLRLYGVKPLGDRMQAVNLTGSQSYVERSYFQNFTLVKRLPGKDQVIKIISGGNDNSRIITLANNIDFSINPETDTEINAPVVFSGYGIRNSRLGIDEVAGLDLKGKLIVRISSFPTHLANKLTAEELSSARREFERYAIQQGASGFLDVNPQNLVMSSPRNNFEMAPAEYRPRPSDPDANYALPETERALRFLRANLSLASANLILDGPGNEIQQYISDPDPGKLPGLQPEENKSVYIKTSVIRSLVNVRNVIGIIEGENPDEFIVLGAHYDHMGMNNGYIWNGADDNGSGTVGIMTIAKALMESGIKPEKSIIIALWSAEEQGLFGSEYFLQNFERPSQRIVMNLNMDMISRYISDDQPDKVVMTYTASQKRYRDITEANLKNYRIKLDVDFQPSDNPPGGTDHRNFVEVNIPVMRFKPGHREEYHTPADESGTIDWDIMEKIVRISYLNILQIAGKTE